MKHLFRIATFRSLLLINPLSTACNPASSVQYFLFFFAILAVYPSIYLWFQEFGLQHLTEAQRQMTYCSLAGKQAGASNSQSRCFADNFHIDTRTLHCTLC